LNILIILREEYKLKKKVCYERSQEASDLHYC
jgi:hypothetical protein